MERFIAISAALTGFDGASLWATGCAEDYLRQLSLVAGPDMTERFLGNGSQFAEATPEEATKELRASVLSDPDLGALARSLIQLWYLGQWTPMPPDWVERNGAKEADVSRILSTRSYQEGLVWIAMRAHPLGAKPTGFGSWAEPPASAEGA